MLKIKKVEYDELDCSGNSYARCPYCGEKNYADESLEDEESCEMECDACEKTFVCEADYTVTYKTQPYENWVIDEIARLERKITYYKGKNTDYAESMISLFQKKKDKLTADKEE